MTEKRFKMINTNLTDENGKIYYNIQRNDGFNICQIYGKNNAKSLIDELNELAGENKELKQFKEKVFDWINGEIDSTKESHNVLLTGDEAEAIMEVLIRFKKELFE